MPPRLIFLRRRGQSIQHPFGRENHDDFRPLPEFGFQCEGSAVELDQAFYDRQTKARAFLGVFFCASVPRPNEDMTVEISSSGIPGPLSRTATY